MFLIVPKRRSTASTTTSQLFHDQAIPRISKGTKARVTTACDRCRIKKVKCNGDIPCARCASDEVVCNVGKRPPADTTGALRGYISSMESQQRSLVRALRQMHRHVQQSVNGEEMGAIMKGVSLCGYGFDALPENLDNQTNCTVEAEQNPSRSDPNNVQPSVENNVSANQKNENCTHGSTASSINGKSTITKKRKREDDQQSDRNTSPQERVPIGEGHNRSERLDGHLISDDSLKTTAGRQNSLAFENLQTTLTGNYWDLENYWIHTQNSSAHTQADAPATFAMAGVITEENDLGSCLDTSFQWPQDFFADEWTLNSCVSPPVVVGTDDMHSSDHALSALNIEPNLQSNETSLGFETSLDWDYTLCWNPSMLSEIDFENAGVGQGVL